MRATAGLVRTHARGAQALVGVDEQLYVCLAFPILFHRELVATLAPTTPAVAIGMLHESPHVIKVF
jgi:hypothetical protein